MNNIKKINFLVAILSLFTGANVFAQQVNITTDGATVSTISAGEWLNITANNVTVTGITIDATGQENGIVINGATGVVIDGVTVTNANGNGIHVVNSSGLTIQNSDFNNNGKAQNVSNTFWPGVNIYAFEAENGLNPYGAGALEMKYSGIYVHSSNNINILNNYSYSNKGFGIKIESLSGGLIQGNVVGKDAVSPEPKGNFGDGILLLNASGFTIDGNHSLANGNREAWDGLTALDTDENQGLDPRNFYGAGIELNSSSNNTVINNFVGTTSDGLSILSPGGLATGNHKHGIYVRINSSNNIIGGSITDRNIVGGNGYAFEDVHTKDSNPTIGLYLYGVAHGVTLHDDGGFTTNNTIQGNAIGYYNGACIPNRQDGVSLLGFYGDGVPVGGLGGNLISENVIGGGEFAVFAQGSWVGQDVSTGTIHASNLIQGNIIGVDSLSTCTPILGGIVAQSGAVNLEITENIISNLDSVAIIVKGDGTENVKIFDNELSCNGGGIDLVDNGNIDFGVTPTQIAVNTLESTDVLITGFSPNNGDFIDVYRAEVCDGGALPCQAPDGDADKAQGTKFVTTILSSENIEFADTLDEEGYFEFDLTTSVATLGGLTHDNVIFVARDTDNNTSEFHKCIAISKCSPPTSVTFSETEINLCFGDTATASTVITNDDGELEDEFIYNLYLSSDLETVLQSNSTGVFEIQIAGVYSVKVFNTENEDNCATWSTTPLTVNIQDLVPAPVISGDNEACVGENLVLVLENAKANSQFDWSYTPSTANVTLADEDREATFVFDVAGDYEISVTETDVNGCSSIDSLSAITVTINPLPTGVSIAGDDDVCAGDEVIYSVTQEAGFSYDWDIDIEDASITINDNVATIIWGVNGGTLAITETNEFGCAAISPSTLEVNVNDLPIITNVIEDTECAGDVVTYSVTNNIGSTYDWSQDGLGITGTTNEVTVTIPDSSQTVLSVYETNSNGCTSETPSTITVNINQRPIPLNLSALPNTDVCIGDAYQVSVDSQADIEFNWSSDPISLISTSSLSNVLDLTGIESGEITVGATNSITGCMSNSEEELSISIVVHDLPVTPVIGGPDSISCSIDTIFNVVSPNVLSQFVWTYGDGAIGTPNHGDTTDVSIASVDFGPRRSTVSVLEIDQFGCVSNTAEVSPVMTGCDPIADFSVDENSYCLGEPVTITEFATYSPIEIEPLVMWFELVGADTNGVTVDSLAVLPGGSVTVNYIAAGEYQVSMVVQQAGIESRKDSIGVVVIKPLASIDENSIIGVTSICQNTESTYEINPNNTESMYTWSHMGAVVSNEISETERILRFGPTQDDVIISVVENRNGCIDSVEIIVDVLPSPEIHDLDGIKSVCEGEELTLTLVGASANSTYDWTPILNITDSNSDSTEVSFRFETAGEYEITVLETDVNGCSAIDSLNIANVEIKYVPNAPVITGESLGGICDGDTATFYSTENTDYSYTWNVSSPDQIIENNQSDIVVVPQVGDRSVSLFVTDNGCSSLITDTTYVVQDSPDAPSISADGEDYCEDEEDVEFVITSRNLTSTYCWTVSMTDATTDDVLCEGNDKISLDLGEQSGQISVVETTSLGCKSESSDVALVNVQLNLGTVVSDGMLGDICSVDSYDSLAQYELTIDNATNITYFTEPSGIVGEESGVGNNREFDIVFPTSMEGESVVVYALIESTIGSKTCDTDSIAWEVDVQESEIVNVSIDNRDVCEDNNALFTASIDPVDFDDEPEFNWYYEDDFVNTGVSYLAEGIEDRDEITIEYIHREATCPSLSKSELSKEYELNAFIDPEVIGSLLTGNGVQYVEDEEYYLISSRDDVELLGELDINMEDDVTYEFKFTWDFEDENYSSSNIQSPVGVFNVDGEAYSNASTSHVPDGQKIIWYYIETTVNDICPQRDSMKLVFDFKVNIPDVVTPGSGTEDAFWTIDNIEQFPNNQVTIINRWGTEVRTYPTGGFDHWNGNSDNGTELPVGTYFYVVDLGDGSPSCSGPIALIR